MSLNFILRSLWWWVGWVWKPILVSSFSSSFKKMFRYYFVAPLVQWWWSLGCVSWCIIFFLLINPLPPSGYYSFSNFLFENSLIPLYSQCVGWVIFYPPFFIPALCADQRCTAVQSSRGKYSDREHEWKHFHTSKNLCGF